MKRSKVSPSYFIVGLVCLGIGYLAGHWQKSDKFSPDTVFANYSGGVVKAQEVDQILQNEIELFNKHRSEARLKITVEIVRQKILELEAEKKHLSVTELVRQYQLAHQADKVTDKELETYTRAQGLKVSELKAQQKENFIKQIKNTRIIRSQEQLADELYRSYGVHLNPDLEPAPKTN